METFNLVLSPMTATPAQSAEYSAFTNTFQQLVVDQSGRTQVTAALSFFMSSLEALSLEEVATLTFSTLCGSTLSLFLVVSLSLSRLCAE